MKKQIASSMKKSLLACACASGLMLPTVHAQQVKTVFVIILENRNFTAGSDTSGGSVVLGNAAAPYLNALITPNDSGTSAQVSYCTAYHNDLATASGNNPSIHPSEPNYVWEEAGSNLSKLDDNDPYGTTFSVQQIVNYLAANPSLSGQHVCGILQAAGVTWKTYQEGIDHVNSTGGNANLGGTLTSSVLPQSQWTVPLASFSGANALYTNPYNGSDQWNFACKHDGSLFFLDTNGSTITTANTATTNPENSHYAPLDQLASDLTNNNLAQYVTITPDQYNDMHTALSAGFTYHGTHYTGDLAQVAQGDNFCSIIVPQIMASSAYQNNGAIIIWTDETEGTNQNDFNHTLTEIVISPLAKGNAYASNLNYTHSSDIATIQEIFGVPANTPTGYLNDAANVSNSAGALAGSAPGFGTGTALDLSDLFVSGAIPSGLPSLRAVGGGYTNNRRANTSVQTVTLTNASATAITTPVYLAVSNLNTTLTNSLGTTANNYSGSAYVEVSPTGLAAGASASVVLQFVLPGSAGISDNLNPFATSGTP